MSELSVLVRKITKVEGHINADRLDVVKVDDLDWDIITSKGTYKVNDLCVYIPVDSILDEKLESFLFPEGSKIKLENHRIRAIKIRGVVSVGMLISIDDLNAYLNNGVNIYYGQNVREILNIKKYEPIQHTGSLGKNISVGKKQINPNFKKYTHIESFRNFPSVFNEDDIVTVSEKIHQTNFRAGWVLKSKLSLWDRILKLFGKFEDYEFVVGSHNVQCQNNNNSKTFYGSNHYVTAADFFNLKSRIPKGYVIYGELCFLGCQANYHYGCKENEYKLPIFDIMYNGKYLNVDECYELCDKWGFEHVPELYRGKFDILKIKELTKGDSVYCPDQKIREGIVIKPIVETNGQIGRKILKYVSDDYLLLKNNTDNH